jgi:hypothetical protein
MNLEKITRVKRLIRLFESRAAAVFDQAEADGSFIVGTAATGALRRTSMELTRALADLRRPGAVPRPPRSRLFGALHARRWSTMTVWTR